MPTLAANERSPLKSRSDGDEVWLSGLPETILLITRGQGFVAAGESVNVETEAAAAAPASAGPAVK